MPTCSNVTLRCRTSIPPRRCSNSDQPTIQALPTSRIPGRPTFLRAELISNAECDQYEDPPCNSCGADDHRRRRDLSTTGSRENRRYSPAATEGRGGTEETG